MYTRSIKLKNQRLNSLVQQSKYYSGFNCHYYSGTHRVIQSSSTSSSLIGNYLSKYPFPLVQASERGYTRLKCHSDISWRNCLLRYYSSEGDGRNANEDKRDTSQDVDNSKETNDKGNKVESSRKCDAHAQLGEQDQIEWLRNEKLALENKRKESPFLTRHERFKNEFLRRIVPWEKITLSWDTFPYYIDENTKNLLVECAASHVKHKKIVSDYGSRLISSSARILLQSIPGTELYRERLVRALARELQVPLMLLDGSIVAPYDLCEDEGESDQDSESTSESDVEDENDGSNEDDSSSETKTEGSDDEVIDLNASAEALRKLIPIEDFEKSVSGEAESSSTSSQSESVKSSDKANRPLKKGDRVRYTGASVRIEANNRTLSSGQTGEVYEVNGDQVAVIFDTTGKESEEVKDEESGEPTAKASVYWLPLKDIEHDLDAQTQDCYVAVEVLCQVLESQKPIIVYFSDSYPWFSKAAPKSGRKEFVNKLQEMLGQLSGPIVLICGRNKVETGSKEKAKFTMILPNLGRLAKLPFPLKKLTEELTGNQHSKEDEIYNFFTNVMSIRLPKEEDNMKTFNKHIEEDRKIVIARSNLTEIHKVLEEHSLSCLDLLHVNTDGVILTKEKAEKVVGWAKSHYLSSCPHPSVKGDRLQLPQHSLEIALLRLKAQETASKKTSQNLKNLAKDDYESNFVSSVVTPGEIGVRFDDVGALEDVKKALKELVILPMRRPELFSHGNLLRPCKGILLFGPPGTGKTLLAKALATEAEANFISITGSTLTSKWFGDAEKLTKALFSFASKLAPVIIFVDEVDSLLGARGGAFEHEATRRMRNEFMAAWDGLRSKESQRILVLGATNRPFDLDDAVIRRLPRRIYVDLPDAENRRKILNIILAKENLEPGFPLEQLAHATEGYSGSDLKNLCVAAAYRPVQELLEEENKGDKVTRLPALRPLKLEDFVLSKAKVGPSVAYDASSMNELRKWNEQYGEGGNRKKSPFGF